MEDKCPKYGTEQHCDCESSKMGSVENLGCLIVMVLCFAGIISIVLLR